MRRVLVTHLDSVVGMRLVKALYREPDVALIFGTGTGPRPSFLDAYRDKCAYQRLDLAKARHLSSFFHSERYARARIDSVVHLPFISERTSQRIPGNVPSLVSETRRLLEECCQQPRIQRFVYLSSAYVYRLEPGNANLFSEDQLLGFEAEGDSEVRAWIDADLICQGLFPVSALRNEERRLGLLPLPGVVNKTIALLEQTIGVRRRFDSFLRYGVVLNTRLATESLGFEPQYRVEVRGTGGERRIDTIRAS